MESRRYVKSKSQKREAQERQRRRPGRPVGVIAVKPKGLPDGDYNPLVMVFTVNKYRKDFNDVIKQGRVQKAAPLLRGYNKDLLTSMFKNW